MRILILNGSPAGNASITLQTMEEGKDYRINDLIAVVPGLETASTHKVSALLTPLKRDGLIERKEIKRVAYFSKA